MDRMEAQKELGIEDTFTKTDLRKCFRRRAFDAHPDSGGSEEAFTILQEAYTTLKKFVVADETDEEARATNGMKLSELGKGYPLTESAKTCETCGGFGYRDYQVDQPQHELVTCMHCGGAGLLRYKCKWCESGTYRHPKTGKLMGPCRSCKGTGWFYPYNKPERGRYHHKVVYIPGTKKQGVPCKYCAGRGERHEFTGATQTVYQLCMTCDGVGEIKMWNPVLPRGFLAKGGC